MEECSPVGVVAALGKSAPSGDGRVHPTPSELQPRAMGLPGEGCPAPAFGPWGRGLALGELPSHLPRTPTVHLLEGSPCNQHLGFRSC